MSKTLNHFIKVKDGAYSAHGGMFIAERYRPKDKDGYHVTKYEVTVRIGRERIVLFDPFDSTTHPACPSTIAEADALIEDYLYDMAAAVKMRSRRRREYEYKREQGVPYGSEAGTVAA